MVFQATITNEVDNAFVMSLCPNTVGINRQCWIGLAKLQSKITCTATNYANSCPGDPACKCAWTWPDDKNPAYTQWAVDKPQFTYSACARTTANVGLQASQGWMDDQCYVARPFICQGKAVLCS